MAGEYIFTLQRVTKKYSAGETVLEDVTLSFFFGAKIGIIGANGSGKSTLLRILCGQDTDVLGDVYVAKGIRIGHLPQEPQLDPAKTVAEIVEEGVSRERAIIKQYEDICDQLGEKPNPAETEKLNNELGRIQDIIDANDLWDLDHNIEQAMDALRLPPGEESVAKLSGGEKRRVALCRLLISNPDALLLDEPTNHLDAESVAWLETYLRKFKGTVVVVTHDRYFLNNVTGWILELEGGRALPFKGNYESWLEQKQALLERESRQTHSRRKLLQQELAWVRLNPSGRRAKGKARLKRYEELAAQQTDTHEDQLEIRIPPGPRLGDLVVRAESVSKSFGDRLLMEDVNFNLPRGGIVGVIGGNGAGKTTLFRMILGQEPVTSGKLILGESAAPAYVDQSRDMLDPDKTVYEEITGGLEFLDLGGHQMNGRVYCSRFNFKGTDQQKQVGRLSGGERNRVHLAKLLRGGGNLLLLDEPTNDLDVNTLRSLEEAICDFGGCAVVVSHDRWFLDRIATHIIAFEGNSRVSWFEGNYADYHEHRRALLGDAADRPQRMRFRPVSIR